MKRVAVFIDFHGRDRSFLLEGIGDYLEAHAGVEIHRRSSFVSLTFDQFLDDEVDARVCWLSDPAAIEALQRKDGPRLNLCANRACGAALQRVRFDTHALGSGIARFFLQAGFAHFAYAMREPALLPQWGLRGFAETLRAAGRTSPVEIDCNTAAFQEWLAACPKPVGVLTRDDIAAESVVESAKQLGVAVPDEMAVVGIGNHPASCRCIRPSISSVRLDYRRLGFEGMRWVCDRLRGETGEDSECLIAPLPMVERESTNVLHLADGKVGEAVRFIRAQAHRGIQVQDVAEHVGLTRHALEKRYLYARSRSPTAEINLARVDRACRQLSDSAGSLAYIARECGFSDVRQMRRNFLKAELGDPGSFKA